MIKRKKSPKKKPRPKLLIVCEGKVTEKIYLTGVRVDFALQHELFQLRFAAGTPRSLVDEAVRLKRENAHEFRREPLLRYTEVWCVFDRDEHDYVTEAIQKARTNNVKIAFSNPNFELFLLLHFEACNRAYDRHTQSRLLRQHIPDYVKSFDYEILRPLYPAARARAIEINNRAEVNQSVPSAPFTSAFGIIDSIISLGGKKVR